jgi:predicted dehydrogenase
MRLGIVGCGAVVREYHLPAIVRCAGVEVRALCDRDLPSAVSAGRQFGLDARVTDRLDEFAREIDAALVAVPPRAHAPVTIELLSRGVHVLCEKPIAVTSAEARAMIQAAAESQRILAVGLLMRFHPSNRMLKAVLEEGLVGRVREVVAEYGVATTWEMRTDSYFNPSSTTGGVLLDTGAHLIDRLIWLFGPLRIDSYEDDSFGGVEANARLVGAMTIERLEIPCRVEVSWTHTLDNTIRVIGSEATAAIDLGDSEGVTIRRTIRGRPVVMRLREEARCGDTVQFDFFRVQIEDFVRAVEGRGTPLADAESATASIEVIESAYAMRRRMTQSWVETGGPAV